MMLTATSPSFSYFSSSRLTRSPTLTPTSPTLLSPGAAGPLRTLSASMKYSTAPASGSVSPPSPQPILQRRKSKSKPSRPPPLRLRSIDEESGMSEYDVGVLNLGSESPRSGSTTNLVDNTAFVQQWAEAGIEVPRVPPRHPLWKSTSFGKLNRGLKKELDDRDCGICFEYAVVPCRTLCCGKIFCTEHLADWLHGPNAEGRCPNCENACSLEGGTLSLAAPSLRTPTQQSPPPTISRRSTLTPSNRSTFQSSPLTHLHNQSNDTLNGAREHEDCGNLASNTLPSSCSTSSSTTLVSSEKHPCLTNCEQEAEKSHRQQHHYRHPIDPQQLYKEGFTPLDVLSVPPMNFGSTPFSNPLSRLLSIITFLLLVYKLLS